MSTKKSFQVHVQSQPLLRELDDELLDAFPVALERERRIAAPVASANLATHTLSMTASVDIARVERAAAVAVEAFTRAARRAGVSDVVVAELEILPEDARGDRTELISGAEVARRIAVSRERVSQLAESPRFPPAVATVGAARIWRWGDIVDWMIARGAAPPRLRAVKTRTRGKVAR